MVKKERTMSESFLGYGSPEALEQAIKAGEGEDFTIYRQGICMASVCSSLGKEETVSRMASIPSGTTAGWLFCDNETFHTGEPNPCPCNEKPETHKHYLFEC